MERHLARARIPRPGVAACRRSPASECCLDTRSSSGAAGGCRHQAVRCGRARGPGCEEKRGVQQREPGPDLLRPAPEEDPRSGARTLMAGVNRKPTTRVDRVGLAQHCAAAAPIARDREGERVAFLSQDPLEESSVLTRPRRDQQPSGSHLLTGEGDRPGARLTRRARSTRCPPRTITSGAGAQGPATGTLAPAPRRRTACQVSSRRG